MAAKAKSRAFKKTKTAKPTSAASMLRELRAMGDPQRAQSLQRYFKTAVGEYGAGDKFLGLTVPMIRTLAKQNRQLDAAETELLLASSWHEARLLALMILVEQYEQAEAKRRAEIYKFYLSNSAYINNWDLVDSSAEQIVGAHLQQRSRAPLYRLVRSSNLWERRIAVLATFRYIKQNEFAETLRIAEKVLHDEHDLIHKAVGWMLREVGKRDANALQVFLDTHAARMPRTMLRYAIERFTPTLRQKYMSIKRVS